MFQAMRPVFSDLVTEMQRSIGYFTSIDRKAKIGRVVALGNAMKLPGLQRFLAAESRSGRIADRRFQSAWSVAA